MQRRILHVCMITLAVVVLAITFDGFRDLLFAPGDTIHRWFYGPPRAPIPVSPVAAGGTYTESSPSSPVDLVFGAAAVCTVVAAIVALLYCAGILIARRIASWRILRSGSVVVNSRTDGSDGQPN